MDSALTVLWILFYVTAFIAVIIKNEKNAKPGLYEVVSSIGAAWLALILIFNISSCVMDSFNDNLYKSAQGPRYVKGYKPEPKKRNVPGGNKGKGREIETPGKHEEIRRKQRSEFLRTGKIEGDPAYEQTMQTARDRVEGYLNGTADIRPGSEGIEFTKPEEIAVLLSKNNEYIILSDAFGVELPLKDGKPIRLNTVEANDFIREYPKARYANPDVAAKAEKVRSTPAPVEPTENKTENGPFNPAEGAPEIKTPEKAPVENKPESKNEETDSGTFNPTNGVPGIEERLNQTTNSTSEVIAPRFRPGTRAEKELELIQKSDLSNEATYRMLDERLYQLWEDGT